MQGSRLNANRQQADSTVPPPLRTAPHHLSMHPRQALPVALLQHDLAKFVAQSQWCLLCRAIKNRTGVTRLRCRSNMCLYAIGLRTTHGSWSHRVFGVCQGKRVLPCTCRVACCDGLGEGLAPSMGWAWVRVSGFQHAFCLLPVPQNDRACWTAEAQHPGDLTVAL